MTLHAFIEYVKYKVKAKKLHGVHSPFVYSFSEDVLYSNKYASDAIDITTEEKYNLLTGRIQKNYQLTGPQNLSITDTETKANTLFAITDDNPGHWLQIINKHVGNLTNDSFIVIPGIHKNKRCSAKWKRITSHPKIPMSIDLYGLGVLVIKNEFKEKQHFTLKY